MQRFRFDLIFFKTDLICTKNPQNKSEFEDFLYFCKQNELDVIGGYNTRDKIHQEMHNFDDRGEKDSKDDRMER